MFAARYSSNIKRDFEREYSFCGWGIEPVPTEDECRCFGDQFPAWCDDPEDLYGMDFEPGYLPARNGLCAYVGETPEEAIEKACKVEWLADGELYVFPCKIVGDVDSVEEMEQGAFRVIPIGDPLQLEKEDKQND